MFNATVQFEGITDLYCGRFFLLDPEIQNDIQAIFPKYVIGSGKKPSQVVDNDWEVGLWRYRAHADHNTGEVFISRFALKNLMFDAAAHLKMKIPGEGKSTFVKHFKSSIFANGHMRLGINRNDIQPLWLHVPSDGTRGGSKRVQKGFPVIPAGWKGTASFFITYDKITREIFQEHLDDAGIYCGLGSLRVANGGIGGQFKAKVTRFERG